MDKKPPKAKPAQTTDSREERLKQALKANLARRKQQARARKAVDDRD
ncbi:hypothetical protein [Actibacterium sp. D379-3]